MRSVGLVKGEWVAIDGSEFQTVSSVRSVRERETLDPDIPVLVAAKAEYAKLP